MGLEYKPDRSIGGSRNLNKTSTICIQPMNQHPHQIAEGLQSGDPAAWRSLFQEYAPRIWKYVARRMEGRAAAGVADVVQETMMEANRRMATFLENPGMPFHLWIRQIATDRLIDQHRRHRVSKKRSVDLEQAPVVASNLDHSTIQFGPQLQDRELTPAEAAIRAEMQRRFEQAIEEMDEHDQEIIVMRHFEKLSNQEVANVLGLTEPAASMRYLRAVRRLQKQLAPDQPEE